MDYEQKKQWHIGQAQRGRPDSDFDSTHNRDRKQLRFMTPDGITRSFNWSDAIKMLRLGAATDDGHHRALRHYDDPLMARRLFWWRNCLHCIPSGSAASAFSSTNSPNLACNGHHASPRDRSQAAGICSS